MTTVRNGGVSFWWHQVGLPSPTDRLEGDATCSACTRSTASTGPPIVREDARLVRTSRVARVANRLAGR